MEHVRTSARGLVRRGDEMLVIRYRSAHGDWYCLPGGGQQHGENLEASLIREIAEETGAQVRVGPLCFVRECMWTPDARTLPPGFHQVEMVFFCELLTPLTGASVPDPGQTGMEWRTAQQLRNLCFYPQALLDALESGKTFGYLGVI